MMKFLISLIVSLLIFSCTKTNDLREFRSGQIDFYSDHKILSSQELISSGLEVLLNQKNNKKDFSNSFYEESWLYAIQSTPKWPNKLEVKLKEHQPLARWESSGYLTHSGFLIFPLENSVSLLLVNLSGPEEKKFKILNYSRNIQSELNRFGESITEVKLNSSGEIKAFLTSGADLVFSEENFRDQLKRLEDFISFELVSGRLYELKHMDFRYKNGISVLFN